MSEFYNRVVSVLVGPKNAEGLLIENLRMAFKVERTAEKSPNTAMIQIWNLSRASRAVIEAKNSAIILNAGYGTNVRNIFVGDVARVVTRFSGPDTVTEIEAGDGEIAYQTKNANKSFAPGSTVGQVLDFLAGEFGLSKGTVKGVNENDQYPNGASFSGMVRDQLDEVLTRQGLEWSIQDNQLQILPPDSATDEEAVVLSSTSGLIGSPFKTKIVNQSLLKKKDGVEAQNGVQARSLLNAMIRPGRYVRIISKAVNDNAPEGALFRVSKVIHSGDTHAGPFYSDLEAV